MVLLAGHGELSVSAMREGCAEVRDVFVAEPYRRRGVARAIMAGLEGAARDGGFGRIGLAVGTDDAARSARALYEELGYGRAHGPFVVSTSLEGDDGPIPVGAVLTYLVKDL
jgi:GNAT superfamily N-acetyltransferase